MKFSSVLLQRHFKRLAAVPLLLFTCLALPTLLWLPRFRRHRLHFGPHCEQLLRSIAVSRTRDTR
jgi:hypothetical protein